MKSKKFFSVLCAAAILLSVTTSTVLLKGTGVTHAEEIIDGESVSQETEPDSTNPEESNSEELTVPENLRFEDGYIVWDEVETASGKKAYGYDVQVYNDHYETRERYYTTRVEFDRFCYDHNWDFGEYQAKVCAFDETNTMTEWSSSVTVSYAPAFDTPANVRFHEEWDETIEWDEVVGAARYNIRIFNNDEERTLYTTSRTSSSLFQYKWSIYESGDYLISVQAMDKDYNVSEWTTPLLISHTTHTKELRLEPPQNVRLDESGENVLWDEVDGATGYKICVLSYDDYKKKPLFAYSYDSATEARYDNWKSIAAPFSDGEYKITVWAYGEGYQDSHDSEPLTVDYKPQPDEAIGVPDDIWEENGYLRWKNVDGAVKYWMFISACDELIEDEWSCLNDTYYYIGNSLPEGTYEAELFVVDENNNYNSKTFSFTRDTVHEETIWIPEVYYKFDDLLWDYDELRHSNTQCFWIRLRQGDTIVKLVKSWGGYFYGLPDLTDGEYSVDVCVYEYTNKLGPWSVPLEFGKHDDGLFDKKNETTGEVERDPAGEEIPDEDRILSITINPAFNMKHKDGDDVELDLSKITIMAKEIYDEEGLQRASEALGELIKGNNKHFNVLDLTLLYDGEDFSNGYDGLVQVIIPIPAGHIDKKFSCYRLTEIDGKTVKEEIPGEQTEDSYIIYLEHFSEYAMVGSGDKDEHTHVYGESWESDENGHWHVCECGERSEVTAHTFGEWITTKEATEDEEGEETHECEICEWSETRSTDKLGSNDVASNNFTGSFTIPDTAAESTVSATVSPAEDNDAESSVNNSEDVAADTTSASSAIIPDETTAETTQAVDNNTAGNTDDNNSASPDKNINTGVTLAIVPVIAAGAAGIILLKRKK